MRELLRISAGALRGAICKLGCSATITHDPTEPV
jgi:hypothetical protein